MLLSPAGLVDASLDPSSSTASQMFLSVHDRRQLRLGDNRPPIKRTTSTASIDDGFSNSSLNNPAIQRVIDPNDLSSDDDIGTQEDWEMEEDDDEEDGACQDDNPFLATPPANEAGTSIRLDVESGSSPTSPTATRLQKRTGHSRTLSSPLIRKRRGLSSPLMRKPKKVARMDRDDVANNPFLSRPTDTPRAPRASKQANKVSYVFRGKRITYDAPLESLFPSNGSDSETEALYKSGPRTLFPTPTAPSSTVTLHAQAQNVSPDTSKPTISQMELMQTPRRPLRRAAARDGEITGKGDAKNGNVVGNGKHKEYFPLLPPTPASLRVAGLLRSSKDLRCHRRLLYAQRQVDEAVGSGPSSLIWSQGGVEAEIEAKKQKLAELKKARLDRQATLADSKSGRSTPGLERERGPSTRAQLDELVSSLLGSGSASPRDRDATATTPSGTFGGDRSVSGRTSRLSEAATSDDRHESVAASVPSTSGLVTSGTGAAGSVSGEAATLTTPDAAVSAPGSVNNIAAPVPVQPFVPPKPAVTTYEKGIQTVPVAVSTAHSDDEEDLDEAAKAKTAIATEAEIRARILKEIEVQKEIERLEAEEREKEEERLRNEQLSQSDLSNIYASNDFQNFLDKSSKILERALNDNYDYLRDYTIGDGDAGFGDQADRVKEVCVFHDDRWCRNRSVTSLDWSPKFPELSVAAYNKNAMSLVDPDGIACVWNLHLIERPEFIFHSQSDLLSVLFSPFHPNLLIGGTYAGQILVWDTRSKSLPVLKSPLSAYGHTHPVYSLSLVGTQNAHNLISASTDGTICSWTMDMLARPQETLELLNPQHPKTDEVSITSMAFQGNETTTMLVGTEEGHIHAANRYDRAGAKAGLLPGETYKAHSGPVLGIDYHPVAGPIDFSDLFLSCGVDWTVRLWRSKGSSTTATASHAPPSRAPSAATVTSIAPLHTFEESNDYVLDARWHPAHPAMFGTVDAAGKFDIWNLNVDTDVPTISTTVGSENSRKGLNKLAWDKRDGRHVSVGSSDGKVHIYDIGGLAAPRDTEWDLLRRTVASMSNLDQVGR